MPGNTDGRTTVGDTGAEGADVTRLMTASQSQVVVLAIDRNVLVVPLAELLDSIVDVLHATGLTHLLCAVVGVASGTVPVALERLGVEGHLDAPLLSDADEQVTCHPEVVAHGDALARTNLELPLGGHDLRVDAGYVHTGVEARTVVRLNQVTGEDLASA